MTDPDLDALTSSEVALLIAADVSQATGEDDQTARIIKWVVRIRERGRTALSAANALIAESADEKAAMQAERDEAPTEQSARVAFKSWPVDTQRRFIRQLQDEHELNCV